MNILNQLTIKHLKMNKKRTVVTIMGVILSTALMVGIGLLLSTLRNNVIESIVEYNGDQHVVFKNVDYSKSRLITDNEKVSKSSISSLIGYAYLENCENEYKPYLKVVKADDEYLNKLELLSGRLPKDEKEIVISNHIKLNGKVEYQIGDKLSLNVGKRYINLEDYALDLYFVQGETLIDLNLKEYNIVGIVKRDVNESYSDPGYSIFTKTNFDNNDKVSIQVNFNKVKDVYKNSEIMGKKIYDDDVINNIEYNDSLLVMYGVTQYSNILDALSGVLTFVLTLISIGCIIVIYNSFAISVMERKKQFGLFSSIGATKIQLRKTVFFEAIIIGLIGIPLGLISSYAGIGIVLKIINHLVPDLLGNKLNLVTYPLFVIIPIIFMILVILISAFIPSKMASKATPIESIKQNDDIKIKKNKIKSNRLVVKIFGPLGDLAHKNMKRNKKKYRITTASLVMSVVLFISFSSFVNYVLMTSTSYTGIADYDIFINYSKYEYDEVQKLLNHEQIDGYNTVKSYYYYSKDSFEHLITDEAKESLYNNEVIIVGFEDKKYDEYLKKIGKTEVKPILYNRFKTIVTKDGKRTSYDLTKLKTTGKISLCSNELEIDCFAAIEDYYMSTNDFLGHTMYASQSSLVFIVRESELNKYTVDEVNNKVMYTYISAHKYDNLDKEINETIESDSLDIMYVNVTEGMKLLKNAVLVVKILVYGFITLVTLIGITSVFNTINTSVALRRKEFAMLRSMGLNPRGFNKIIQFESLFVGLRSLIISIPISLLITIWLDSTVSDIAVFNDIIIPWNSLIISVFGVFAIILLTMLYATKKIKNENILDAIREENI